jgi:DNA-binding protein HU-beta
VNKHELIVNVMAAAAGDKLSAEEAVNFVFAQIADTLARGEEVKISGFGTFKRVETKARAGFNPSTGERIEIPAGHKIKFKASSKLKSEE